MANAVPNPVRVPMGSRYIAAMRLLLWLILLVVASPVGAMPALDPAAHPLLALISTDKASYAPGDRGDVLVSLRNPGTADLNARLVTTLFRNEAQIAQTTNAISIAATQTIIVRVPFTAPPSDNRGYRVDVALFDAAGTSLDRGFGSIDLESGALPARFPRQCWVSKWGPDIDATALMDSQVAWRCNIVQGYANYYRPEVAPPPALASWPSLSNLPVSRKTISAVIAAAHARRMPVLFFQATGEAYSDFLAKKTGPALEQGSFTRACSAAQPCTEADMDRSPSRPDNWTQYGWQADHLDLFDLCSTAWQYGLLSRSIKPMLDQFAFDGWQADTLGPPDGARFNSQGNRKDPGACLSDFTSGAQAVLGKPVIVNNVMGWHALETARDGSQPLLYRETWNFDTPRFQQIDLLTDGSAGGLRRYTSRAIVQPGYLQRSLSESCSARPDPVRCIAATASPRLATAMFAIAGSTFMNHMDDGCMATNVFMEGYHLPCPASLVDALLAYKNFEVAYQPMLRDGVTPSAEGCMVTSGMAAGSNGTAGQAYVLGRTKAGFQICQLLNLNGVPADRWTDLDGTMPGPTPASNIGMKLYYAGPPVTPGANRLWWASPDSNNGAATVLSYTAEKDAAGQYVRFTLPSLAYWSMVVLETKALADDDFHIDPTGLIRGANFSDASNGVGSAHTVTSGTCCGRSASYPGIEFGTASPVSVKLLYGASAATRISFRLDGPSGPVIGTCPLSATGGPGSPSSVTCPISGATGRRTLTILFESGDVSLYNFSFQRLGERLAVSAPEERPCRFSACGADPSLRHPI